MLEAPNTQKNTEEIYILHIVAAQYNIYFC